MDLHVQILAHEIGHNLGMNHDFVGSDVDSVRTDSKGNLCTKVGGVMDYYGAVTLWSTCSVEDFLNYYNSLSGNACSIVAPTTTTRTTARTTTRTTTKRTTRTTTKRTTRTTTKTTTKMAKTAIKTIESKVKS